ncbi:hypothetical protein PLESTB_000606100 [Pleodorina starrii]|uniref:Uncharacterized protein n=1 Tax=Pleodorina starrii TaxID=330485 RepID=A0A9W6BI87_9CHLO|nr:hypothetical protein PLESTM_000427100 [Pleodorina starrii]GLC52295.1 hypothetical protein PLESTB_000606100 [Pleodorina starrii]GLC76085.1 hypothetical protein PLESTF_001732800 [Pleodorina starrii]
MTGGGRHGKHTQSDPKESSVMEGVPARSNYGAEHTVTMPQEEGIDVPQRVVPMTAEDDRHMREDLHRNPEELLQRELANDEGRNARQAALRQAVPGNSVEEMAAGVSGRKSPGRKRAEDTPPDFVNDKFREVPYRDAPEAHLLEDENEL